VVCLVEPNGCCETGVALANNFLTAFFIGVPCLAREI
jgi:hypothetical protein